MLFVISFNNAISGGSRWPHSIKRPWSWTARTLRLWVRILIGT